MIRRLLFVHPKFWLFVLGTLTVWFLCSFFSCKSLIARQEQTLEQLNAEYRALIEENAAIQHKIDYTYTDEYIIREARKQDGLVLPGQILFKSVD